MPRTRPRGPGRPVKGAGSRAAPDIVSTLPFSWADEGIHRIMTTPRPGTGVIWARVEEGFHVGSRHGEFLGYIDRQSDGRYLAFDSFSRVVGRFDGLVAAMSAVTDAPGRAPIELRQIP
jgi:hypothetical protein